MSVQAMSWALGQWIENPGAKLVLVAIANYADTRTGSCFPSLDVLGEETCMPRRTIQRHIAALVGLGLVVKQHVFVEGGRQTSNLYTIDMNIKVERPCEANDQGADAASDCDGEAENGGGEGANLAPPRVTSFGTPEGVTGDTLTTLNRQKEPSEEPSPPAPQGVRESARGLGKGRDDDEAGFEAFWSAWKEADDRHRADKRSDAFSAWRKLSAEERAAAARREVIADHLALQARAGRKVLFKAGTYLRERVWTQLPPEKAKGDKRFRAVSLAPWSRPWWIVVHRKVERRERGVGFIVDQARQGLAYGVAPEAVPSAEEEARWVWVLVGSPEWDAWAEWWRHRGATLPRPNAADRVWMPALMPPAPGDGIDDGEVWR